MMLAGVAMLLVSMVNNRTHGVKRCALSCLVTVTGMVLYSGRSVVPGKFIVFLPNVVMLAGLLLMLDGVRAFRRFRRRTGLMLAGTLLFLPAHWYWLYVSDNINARTVVFMLAVLLCCSALTSAMIMGVARRDRGIYWSTAAGFAIYGAAAFLKGCYALWGPPIQFWTGRPVDFVFLTAANVCICSCAFGLSMAINLKLQRETETLALYDPLTQLPNRRHFEETLEGAEQRACGAGSGIALIYCDVDNFKEINDKLGHAGGDTALRLVGNRLQGAVGESACVARVGGDEFLLLIENAPSHDRLYALVQRLKDSVDGEIKFAGRSAALNISCGLAVYPDDVGSVSDLIRLGDAAMYMMKQQHRVPSASPVTTHMQ